jgi:hypothetical protein
VNRTLRRLLRQSESNRAVATTEVDGFMMWFNLEMVDEQLRPLVYLFGTEQSPSAVERQWLTLKAVFEYNILLLIIQ